jgi:hypothetical protein
MKKHVMREIAAPSSKGWPPISDFFFAFLSFQICQQAMKTIPYVPNILIKMQHNPFLRETTKGNFR